MSFSSSIAQKFFLQRVLELLHRQTIDSYRVRVLNTISSLNEVKDIYIRFLEGSVKSEDTLLSSMKECVNLLEKDDVLKYGSIAKEYVITKVFTCPNKSKSDYKIVCFVIDTILGENADYCDNLIAEVKRLVNQDLPEDPYPILEKIDSLSGNMVTELIRLGYTKSYLFSFFRKKFKEDLSNFADRYAELERLPKRGNQYFQVYFQVYAPGLTTVTWATSDEWEVLQSLDEQCRTLLPNHNFGAPKRDYIYLGIKSEALEHFSGLQKAKQALSELLDITKLAYHDRKVEVKYHALVINRDNPVGAALQKVEYISDGRFPRGEEVLSKLKEKLPVVINSTGVSQETKEKIISALRYLRYGNEALELEHQFINYWIGLEYLFSNDKDSTFTRIKTFFPVLHVLVYFKRNMTDFQRSLEKLNIEDWNCFNPKDINSLLTEGSLGEIRDKIFENHPLQSYRAWKTLNRRIRKRDGVKNYLSLHQQHLEWHLIRVYRVRNEIVHEAKYSFQNQTLASNLRYYLAFTLSVILDHFSDEATRTDDLDTFYNRQMFEFDYLKHEKFPIDKLVAMKYDFEILS